MASPGNTEQPGRGVGRVPVRSKLMVTVQQQLKLEETLRYLLTGHSLRECAVLCNVSYTSLAKWCREDETFQHKLKTLSAEVFAELDKQISATKIGIASRIEELSLKALDRMESIIEEGTDNVAYKAAQDILDRNPEIPRNKRFEGEVTQKVVDPAALIHAAAVARELEGMGPRYATPTPSVTVIEAEQLGQS